MNHQPRIVNGWTQRTMFPLDVIECTLKVGLVTHESHCQIQLELRDPTTDTLIGLTSEPCIDVTQIRRFLAAYCDQIVNVIEEHAEPF
jgi:hypothetical protein